jgi:hypothetical protein
MWMTFGIVAVAHADARLDRDTLEAAMRLAGLQDSGLPVSLASSPPPGSSPGVEGWTTADKTGARRVYIYTGSETFRCASSLPPHRQCLLKIASVLVHESWHFRHGTGEADAYAAQIAFLSLHGASALQIAGVHRARAHVLAR